MAKVANKVDGGNQMKDGAVVSRVRLREINMPAPARWERVAETIRDRIRSGEYKTGTQIPSYKRLAEEFGMSVGTILAAQRMLRAEGWVEGEAGVGVWVREDHPK